MDSCRATALGQSFNEHDLCAVSNPPETEMQTMAGQLQLFIRSMEELFQRELQALRAGQEHVERRQAKLEHVLGDWMESQQQVLVAMQMQQDRMPSGYNESGQIGKSRSRLGSSSVVEEIFKEANPNSLRDAKKTPMQGSGSDMGNAEQDASACGKPEPPDGITTAMVRVEADDSKDVDSPRLLDATGKHGSASPTTQGASSSVVTYRRPSAMLTPLQKIVFNDAFDIFFGGIIVANSIFIGIEVEHKTSNLGTPVGFDVTACIFAVAFTIELILRVAAKRPRVFVTEKERMWNLFDVGMVILSLVEAVEILTVRDDEDEDGGGLQSLLRMVRMARLLRILRVLRFSAQLRMMLFMIFESVKSMGALVCILVSILYVFSIVFTMAATEYLKVPGAKDYRPNSELRHGGEVHEYYGSIFRSSYTCFKAMTGGQSWGEVMDVLVDISLFYVFVFLFYIAFALLALLNIITGVFVDGALAKSQNDRDLVVEKELEQKRACIANLTMLFKESDHDNSGRLTHKEFKAMLRDARAEAYLAHLSIDTSNIIGLFDELDKDESGELELDEFVDTMMHLMRAQTVEQYVQKLINENRSVQQSLKGFVRFVEDEFNQIRAFVEHSKNTEEFNQIRMRTQSNQDDKLCPIAGI